MSCVGGDGCKLPVLTVNAMSVVSVVYGPKVMATSWPVNPNFRPGALE